MAGVHIEMPAEVLGRSRWVISPAVQVVGSVQHHSAPQLWPHLTRWHERAHQLESAAAALLSALVPQHGYSPDFLTPPPEGRIESIDRTCERIAETPVELIDYHLDIAFRGRAMPPHVVETFGSTEAFERFRRDQPSVVRQMLRRGGARALARASAEALAAYFAVAIAPDWPQVQSVLEDDIAHHAMRSATHGALQMVEDIGEGVSWQDGGLHLPRPYDVTVDWADDGVLFMPSVSHTGRVLFSAERPATPFIIYPARAVARLWQDPCAEAPHVIADLIGETRAMLLERVARPQSTLQLSRDTGCAPATVSYHLGILLRAGLVHRRRQGRAVLYERTTLADVLSTGDGSQQRPRTG